MGYPKIKFFSKKSKKSLLFHKQKFMFSEKLSYRVSIIFLCVTGQFRTYNIDTENTVNAAYNRVLLQ